jgi:hypothetical protein
MLVIRLLPAGALEPAELDFVLGSGLSRGDLRWNTAGDLTGQNPNINSELTWSDLAIRSVRFGTTIVVYGLVLQGAFQYGWIHEGDNRDSDYTGDDRTGEISRMESSSAGSSVVLSSIAIGYRWTPTARLSITPLVGLSSDAQQLSMKKGVWKIPPAGEIPGLDSRYDARWQGAWFGAELAVRPADRIELAAAFQYHLVRYSAEADWNLRGDLAHPVSFAHEADGSGLDLVVAASYALTGRWSLVLDAACQSRKAADGTDRSYLAAGGFTDTRLNEVRWSSRRIGLSVVLSSTPNRS